ncbi:ectoine/hydroxyectoine ABC transporter permease subunit EhuC [Aneurinibacillus tyrosinisolvens]|uniref:ectoine/hydroxyectoine ABC transporter permease subunit EhuC n=1 Tax=Aneurinibacillus tyrosinisolvens TaxID=1443435 RepID=UPI00191C2762|nr:ectoine/hydroxyectoine ABC transporter permease subunit EhuC [Aneurinibacillus tyrosinisolvens]
MLISLSDILPPLLQGTMVTGKLFIMSSLLAIVVSFVAGLGRLSNYTIVRALISFYVNVFRGTSLLIQLFWLFFALPILGVELSPMVAGVLAMGLNYGAYGSEVVRSSILAIPKGQMEAAIALNMTRTQRMTRVILPQAQVMMLPAFGNLLIELLKGTSLVSLITLADLTFKGMVLRTFAINKTPEILGMMLVIYFIMAYIITLGVRWLERRVSVGRV